MRVRRVLLAVALGLASLGVPALASPAAAATTEWNTTSGNADPFLNGDLCSYDKFTPAYACYKFVGDIWWVEDRAADGHSAAAYWQVLDTDGSVDRQGYCVETRGNGRHGNCNKNYPENRRIRFKMCTVEWGTKSAYQCYSEWSSSTT